MRNQLQLLLPALIFLLQLDTRWKTMIFLRCKEITQNNINFHKSKNLSQKIIIKTLFVHVLLTIITILAGNHWMHRSSQQKMIFMLKTMISTTNLSKTRNTLEQIYLITWESLIHLLCFLGRFIIRIQKFFLDKPIQLINSERFIISIVTLIKIAHIKTASTILLIIIHTSKLMKRISLKNLQKSKRLRIQFFQ